MRTDGAECAGLSRVAITTDVPARVGVYSPPFERSPTLFSGATVSAGMRF